MIRLPAKFLVLVMAVCLAAFLAGCGSRVNQKNFQKIKNDMPQEEVISILGEPTETSSIGVGPFSGTSSVWDTTEGTVTIQFVNGKVKMKTFTSKK
jgi:hypothetical protein